MQDYVSEDKVCESSLRAYPMEMTFVLRIHLQSQANSENEAGNAGYEATEKTVERKGANETTVHKLYDTRQKHVEQIGVDDLELFRCSFRVLLEELAYHR